MKNRLEVAKDLLRDDGLIFVHIDHRMQAHLRILMDETFQNGELMSIITVQVKSGGGIGDDSFLLLC